jgi:hypothetical protein
MPHNNNHDVHARLSKLETLMDSIGEAIDRIQVKLDSQSKVNWAPIAIGVTIFFTVAGSVSTIYNARINTVNTAVEGLAQRTMDLEKGGVERGLKILSVQEKVAELEKDVEELKSEHREHNRR